MWEKLLSMMGGNLFTGVTDLVKLWKLPPEQQLAFEEKMAQIEAEARTSLAKIEADDRISARQREMALAASGHADFTPKVLAYGITVGFFGILFYMLIEPLPEAGHDVLLVMLGALGASWTAIVAYYFGSSSSSAEKSRIISGIANRQ